MKKYSLDHSPLGPPARDWRFNGLWGDIDPVSYELPAGYRNTFRSFRVSWVVEFSLRGKDLASVRSL